MIARILAVFLCLSAGLVPSSRSAVAVDQPRSNLLLFDATAYSGKPDFNQYAIKPLPALHRFFLDRDNKEKVPTEFRLKTAIAEAKARDSDLCFLDIEHWPTKRSDGNLGESLSKYREVVTLLRKVAPGKRLGYYGHPPVSDYWRAQAASDSKEFKSWQQDNDALTELANDVDVLYPSLYTFYPDRSGWVRYAKAQIAEARRYPGHKPVYVFLWPQFHESNKQLGLSFIDVDFWKLQLETVAPLVDGIVLWGGWDFKQNRPLVWDENAAWWRETLRFLAERSSGLKQNSEKSKIND